MVLWMGAAFLRLAYLQLFCYSDYLNRAERQQQRIVEVSPRRGILYDRNFHELAMSLTMESCYAMPAEITDQDMVARLLAGVLGTSPEDVSSKLAASTSFVWLARKLPAEKAARIKEMNLRGVYFVPERQRFYPKQQLASHVLGYVDIDEKGLGGIEYSLDSQIRGRPGRMMVLADARQRWFDSAERGTEAGSNIVLSLDQNIQYIAEKELAQAIRDTHAISGTVLVEETSTGRILAAANWPTFDPNSRGEASTEARMDRAITAMYEPGSVFKIVTAAAALEEGITNPDEVVDCQMGAIYVAGHRIRDHKPFGMLTVAQILAKSSDVGAIKLGLRLGAPKLYDYIRAFGFGSQTGIDLPGEGHGMLKRVENWTPVSVGSISMGQEVGVTAIQLISAMNAIANGGIWVKPHVVLGTRYDTKFISTEQIETRRAISAPTAATMRALLQGVVLEGTGLSARLDGYTDSGKTGTAQKIDPATGRYSQSQTIASFVGFAPINNPAVTILVTLDSPVGLHEGGEVSAPVFKRVAEQVLAYLNVPQDVPLNPRLQRASFQNGQKGSDADVSDFDPTQMESANAPADIVAPPPQQRSLADTPAPTLALVDGETVGLPSLSGKTVREVSEECARLGIAPVLVGTGVALDQDPKAGTTVRRGSRVTVQFGRPALPAASQAHQADKRN
jgi:cell division protein FtsI (penicillin-binding protein 3)